MAQFLGFGDGSDGDLNVTVNTTEAPIDSTCTGSAGASTLTVGAGLTFAAGQIIFIHKTRGTTTTTPGTGEFNRVVSYAGTTLTVAIPLINAYQDSGADQSQVRVYKQYRSVTVQSGISYAGKAWDGDVGGILGFLCSGPTIIIGTIHMNGKGFRGGNGSSDTGQQGEGTAGVAGTQSTAANGNGGGGGGKGPDGGHIEGGHAGAGGNVGAGASGSGKNTATPGTGGSAVSNATLTIINLGGGGGGGGGSFSGADSGSNGGIGGGIIDLHTNVLTVTGIIQSLGLTTTGTTTAAGCGAPGGSGCIRLKVTQGTLGNNLVTATSVAGGVSTGPFNGGGTLGGIGGIRIESCTHTGSTLPAASESKGGQEWCTYAGYIY